MMNATRTDFAIFGFTQDVQLPNSNLHNSNGEKLSPPKSSVKRLINHAANTFLVGIPSLMKNNVVTIRQVTLEKTSARFSLVNI